MLCSSCHATIDGSPQTCPECDEPVLLVERYALQEILGRGAAGVTFRAVDQTSEQVCAVKEIDVGQVEDIKTLELVGREIEVLQRLDHPGIPRYIDDFTVDNPGAVAIYLVQEFVDGTVLTEAGAMDEDDVLECVAELCDILAYLHGLEPPVIHRDIKPSNIMRRADGSLALIDFGAVRRRVVDEAGGSTVAGTFGYMAPEQLRGQASPASDLYGVGATAVAILCGDDAADLIDPLDATGWQRKVHTDFETLLLIQSMLEPRVAERASSATEVADFVPWRPNLRGSKSWLWGLVAVAAVFGYPIAAMVNWMATLIATGALIVVGIPLALFALSRYAKRDLPWQGTFFDDMCSDASSLDQAVYTAMSLAEEGCPEYVDFEGSMLAAPTIAIREEPPG